MIGGLAALAAAAAVGASCRWTWWRRKVSGIPALMYHKIGNRPPEARLAYLWVAPADFRRQLEYLKRRGYSSMLLSELRDAELGRIPMPRKPVLITFDDGYANNYEIAYPILRALGMKANIFLVCGKMGADNSWDKEIEPPIPLMTWAQAREMRDAGVVEFGSHAMSHRRLTQCSAEDVRSELAESKKALEEKLGGEILGFAYPYGDGATDPAVRRLAREAGYRYDFGIEEGVTSWPWSPDSGAIRRLWVSGRDTILDLHLKVTRGKAKLSRTFWR
jgi:peptidoglycan/xylan/chitin deacetylase (PgdA/CDA1 family)